MIPVADMSSPVETGETVPFTRLTPADRALYESYIKQNPNPSYISDLNFNSRMAWNEGFHYHKAILEDTLVMTSQVNVFTGLHFAAPQGMACCKQLRRILDRLWDPYAEMSAVLMPGTKPHLRFLLVPEESLECYRNVSGYEVEVSYNPNYSDYLYDAEKLRTLAGKSMHGKRNHLNRFLIDHPNYQYAPLTKADARDALALTAEWCASKEFDPDDIRSSDYPALKALFENYDFLDVYGGTLREEGELRAFSAYSRRGDDCVFCHFEKAAKGHEDFYVAINALTLRNEFPNVRWVNREEDLGREGLRKAKLSYKPVRQVHKYEVVFTRKD